MKLTKPTGKVPELTTLTFFPQQLRAGRQRPADPRLTSTGEVIDTYPHCGNRAANQPR